MKTIFTVLLAATLLVATSSHAALIMHVDTANKQFAFSGTESGVQVWGTSGYVSSGGQTSPSDFVSWGNTVLEIGNSPFWYGQFGYNSSFDLIVGTLHSLTQTTPGNPATFTTITGTGVSLSYASLDTTSQAKLEGLATGGGTLEWSGVTADDIQVTTDAIPGHIPEPSQVSLMIAALALLGSLRFRAKRHA